MSTNFLQPGDVMTFTAPTGGVTSGVPVLVGGFFVIPTETKTVGLSFSGKVHGVFTLNKTITEGALVEGMPAFWDVTNAKFSILSDVGHLPIGMVAAAALTGDTTGTIRLNGSSMSGRMIQVRKRLAVATVNAGATLVPAIQGVAYRLVSARAIAVGGAATTVTTVDILGTLSAASRKLVAFAQASLTQSTVLTDGGAGAAVLADGASYTKNDAGTAITVGITGGGITVATSIDLSVTYAIE